MLAFKRYRLYFRKQLMTVLCNHAVKCPNQARGMRRLVIMQCLVLQITATANERITRVKFLL